MRLLPCGDRAIVLEADDTADVLGWTAAIEQAGLDVVDVVPAARTVLVTVATADRLPGVREAISRLRPATAASRAEGPVVEIPTVYTGPDLDEVARLTGLDAAEVIAAHTQRTWTVAFIGFAPGFGYLIDGNPRLEVPRREQPRTRVPAGSVGLAGTFSAVYPGESPGGWQLIGRTELSMFDLNREPPALLAPGTRVRFIEVDR